MELLGGRLTVWKKIGDKNDIKKHENELNILCIHKPIPYEGLNETYVSINDTYHIISYYDDL